MQRILDQRPLDKHGFGAGDDAKFDGKILYAKAKAGVFPPTDFDSECVERSNKAPAASLELEHVRRPPAHRPPSYRRRPQLLRRWLP